MKKFTYKCGLAAVITTTCLLFACNNNQDTKDNKDSLSATAPVGDTLRPDTSANGSASIAPAAADTSAALKTSEEPAHKHQKTVKINPAKKGHKGAIHTIVYAPAPAEKMEQDKEGVYNYAEVKPEFPGGQDALDKFIKDNIQYPQDAMDNGVEGTVTVIFAVNENGKVFTPKLKDEKLGYGLDEEALGAVRKMPRWTPGKIKGKNVKTYYDLPITFTLAD